MGPAESTTGGGPTATTAVMDIKERMRKEKDQLFEHARAWRERNPEQDLRPVIEALLPDGQVSSFGLPDGVWPAVLQQAGQHVKTLGAVAALFFGDGPFETADGSESGRSLFCYLTSTNWEELWVWHYRDGEEGLAWDETMKTIDDFALGAGFSPFSQVPMDRGRVH